MQALASPGEIWVDEPSRIRLGANVATSPDLLHDLAHDPAVTVRAAVAMNRAAPPAADLILARDIDERVRSFLGQKLARLLPGVTASDRNSAQAHILAVLASLVEDAAVRVRATIADCVKSMPDAPRALILRLAHDQAVPVSDPVIRLSPLLTDADLLALLAALPNPGTAHSIANRPGLGPQITDAIAAINDSKAIRALLANSSAIIREATLDALVAQAPRHTDWHEPLIRRPKLSPTAARALADMVAAGFIQELLHRADLEPTVSAALQARLTASLVTPRPTPPSGDDELLAFTRRLHAANGLTEAAVLDAARRGDQRRVAAQLSVASGLPLSDIDRAVGHRNGKMLVSIVWRAGFSMKVATLAQALLGLSPANRLATATDGGFPLTVDEMRWQVEMLHHPN